MPRRRPSSSSPWRSQGRSDVVLTVVKYRFREDGVAWPATSSLRRGRQRRTLWVTLIIPTSRPQAPRLRNHNQGKRNETAHPSPSPSRVSCRRSLATPAPSVSTLLQPCCSPNACDHAGLEGACRDLQGRSGPAAPASRSSPTPWQRGTVHQRSSGACWRVAAELSVDHAREPQQLGENLPSHGGSSHAAAARLFGDHPAREFGPKSPNSRRNVSQARSTGTRSSVIGPCPDTRVVAIP